MNYSSIEPIEEPIRAERQSAKRHYGVHPYFTRRPHNVVARYIQHYSKEGDKVLDPFGGSGVTAIEAFLQNRIGIQNDINPLANFIAKGVADLANGDEVNLHAALSLLENKCKDTIRKIYSSNGDSLNGLISNLHLPDNVSLPKTSDVRLYYELFSRRQLLSLAALKNGIDDINDEHVKSSLLLAWSATLTKLNKTFLSTEGRAESRGGSSIFSIYRYKIAKEPIELPPWETFRERAMNVINAKTEIRKIIELKERAGGWFGAFEAFAEDVESLSGKLSNSIDYIFTDPPYGGHISYLDLSTLWNSWLGFEPDINLRRQELIVGGELGLNEDKYVERLGKSIEACVRMLKNGRWLSVVFQHWNIRYFEAILSSASHAGADLRAAVSQVGDPIWSMHKKKNKESVMSGELILTFCKTGVSKTLQKKHEFDIEDSLDRILSRNEGTKVFGEYLFNQLILDAWKCSSIETMDISKADFIDLLERRGWRYDTTYHYWLRDQYVPSSLFELSP